MSEPKNHRDGTALNRGKPDGESPIDQATLRQIDNAALKQAGGDAALWFHYRALFEGEYQARLRSREAWVGWRRSKLLPQYVKAEASAIEGWRRYVENTLQIPRHTVAKRTHIRPTARLRGSTLYSSRDQQADDYWINRAIIFDACRRADNVEKVAKLLEERADSIRAFAASGDVAFFRALGRLLSASPRSSLKDYTYAHLMLSNWLTGWLWLMPERTAADLVECWRGRTLKTARDSDKALRHFKDTKRKYRLKSHSPSIIDLIDSKGNLVLTSHGKELLKSVVVA